MAMTKQAYVQTGLRKMAADLRATKKAEIVKGGLMKMATHVRQRRKGALIQKIAQSTNSVAARPGIQANHRPDKPSFSNSSVGQGLGIMGGLVGHALRTAASKHLPTYGPDGKIQLPKITPKPFDYDQPLPPLPPLLSHPTGEEQPVTLRNPYVMPRVNPATNPGR